MAKRCRDVAQTKMLLKEHLDDQECGGRQAAPTPRQQPTQSVNKQHLESCMEISFGSVWWLVRVWEWSGEWWECEGVRVWDWWDCWEWWAPQGQAWERRGRGRCRVCEGDQLSHIAILNQMSIEIHNSPFIKNPMKDTCAERRTGWPKGRHLQLWQNNRLQKAHGRWATLTACARAWPNNWGAGGGLPSSQVPQPTCYWKLGNLTSYPGARATANHAKMPGTAAHRIVLRGPNLDWNRNLVEMSATTIETHLPPQ